MKLSLIISIAILAWSLMFWVVGKTTNSFEQTITTSASSANLKCAANEGSNPKQHCANSSGKEEEFNSMPYGSFGWMAVF